MTYVWIAYADDHKSRFPLTGSGLSLGKKFMPQPLGYAMCTRPITTKSMDDDAAHDCWILITAQEQQRTLALRLLWLCRSPTRARECGSCLKRLFEPVHAILRLQSWCGGFTDSQELQVICTVRCRRVPLELMLMFHADQPGPDTTGFTAYRCTCPHGWSTQVVSGCFSHENTYKGLSKLLSRFTLSKVLVLPFPL